ncbi:thioesterase II family protein [Brevibacillus sp. SAFN-007a]|uniref:thioesterase II family protein n=1 Tax=Brevibacillus sp. SAFN-007a TaxID=3436862 RepID=UPI003F805079
MNFKLFCLPYAGGSSSIYYKWKQHLHSSIKLIPVELAGRGKRLQHPFYTDFEEAIDDILKNIATEIDDSPYAIFGHSMGGLLTFELVHKINSCKLRLPSLSIISGVKPPHLCSNKIQHNLSDEDLKIELLKLGGTPEEIINNDILFSFFLPVIKADFKLIESYKFEHKDTLLPCRLLILHGTDDQTSTFAQLKEWVEYTSKPCEFALFEGGHFFIHDNIESITGLISEKLFNTYKH